MGTVDNTLTRPEKFFLVGLSVILLIGAVFLHAGRVRGNPEIRIVKNGVKEVLSLAEVERALSEKRVININTAGGDELEAIPGIGSSFAGRIIEYRQVHGNFYDEAGLMGVKGIGEKKLEKIREYIKFE